MNLGMVQEQRLVQHCSICNTELDQERTRKRALTIDLFGAADVDTWIDGGNCPASWCLSDQAGVKPPTVKRRWTKHLRKKGLRLVSWGHWYGYAEYKTPRGRIVRLYRKGQRCRWYDKRGRKIGPEHSNVAPAVAYAMGMGWKDTGRRG